MCKRGTYAINNSDHAQLKGAAGRRAGCRNVQHFLLLTCSGDFPAHARPTPSESALLAKGAAHHVLTTSDYWSCTPNFASVVWAFQTTLPLFLSAFGDSEFLPTKRSLQRGKWTVSLSATSGHPATLSWSPGGSEILRCKVR